MINKRLHSMHQTLQLILILLCYNFVWIHIGWNIYSTTLLSKFKFGIWLSIFGCSISLNLLSLDAYNIKFEQHAKSRGKNALTEIIGILITFVLVPWLFNPIFVCIILSCIHLVGFTLGQVQFERKFQLKDSKIESLQNPTDIESKPKILLTFRGQPILTGQEIQVLFQLMIHLILFIVNWNTLGSTFIGLYTTEAKINALPSIFFNYFFLLGIVAALIIHVKSNPNSWSHNLTEDIITLGLMIGTVFFSANLAYFVLGYIIMNTFFMFAPRNILMKGWFLCFSALGWIGGLYALFDNESFSHQEIYPSIVSILTWSLIISSIMWGFKCGLSIVMKRTSSQKQADSLQLSKTNHKSNSEEDR